MSKAWAKRPSPAMIVAMIALFAALGGSAYAAKKIGSNEIKANAITTGKIKKNAITTSKIKKEAVTGAKINETTLGPVPSATNATNAVNATNWSRYVVIPITKASVGQTVQLYTNGPFTFYGRCGDAGGGETEAHTFVTTTEAGSSMSSYEDSYYQADFNPGTEAQINYTVDSSGPESNEYDGNYYQAFTAMSPNGSTRLAGSLASAVNYFGSPCSFWGNVTINS
jgi:hypothetical protein